jgi:ABC-type Fe3+-hydroxamate transport system substrate-binding protein
VPKTKPWYTCRRFPSVGPFEYMTDFRQASDNIKVRFPVGNDYEDDEGWQPTPFQVADARHRPKEAEKLIAKYFR